MINKEIKRLADNRDLISLKYVFVDALDVDPTFDSCEEDYDYCKSIPNLLENHVEITPFIEDTSMWDEEYWAALKNDLIKNFSEQRMAHMRKVAKVVFADKVRRILEERSKYNNIKKENHIEEVKRESIVVNSGKERNVINNTDTMSESEKQAERIKKRKEEIARNNAETEAKISEQDNKKQNQRSRLDESGRGEHNSKNLSGIIVLLGAIILLAAGVYYLSQPSGHVNP